MSNIERILVVGGGIAGLTFAAAMSQRGMKVELVERNSDRSVIGAGIAVQPNGMRVLCQLGLGEAVQQAGAVLRRWRMRDRQGAVLCEIDLEALWGSVGPFVGIERLKLQNALAAGSAWSRPRLGTWPKSLIQDGASVSVELNDGMTGTYDLVVGADGVHSSVRSLSVDGPPSVYGGQMVWRSLAPIAPSEPESVEFWLGDNRFFGLCPVGGGRTYGFGNVTGPRFRDVTTGRLDRLRRSFSDFGAPIQDYLAALRHDDQVHCGPIEWLESDQWGDGRVVLIGDAAHASSPMMGQGGCMAMEDAAVLAETLISHGDAASALDRFIERRRPRTRWVQQQSRAVGDLLRRPPTVRNLALREHGERAHHDRFQPLIAPH